MTSQQKAFINKILPGAIKAQYECGVLASLTLAQSILESGWGKAAIGNNLFGIKATSSWTGKKQFVWTTEYVNGKSGKYQLWFRDYSSIDDSIEDHAKLLTMPRYKNVLMSVDYIGACKQVQACGYATDPNYAKMLISEIEQYGLNQWDRSYPPCMIICQDLTTVGVIKDGHTYSPVRSIGEKLNAVVGWNGSQATINGKAVDSIMINNHAYARVVDIAGLVGATTSWDDGSKTVTIK